MGSHLLRFLSSVNAHVLCLQRGPEGDIRRYATWQQALRGADIVFHLAAQTSVSVAEKDPWADYQINVLPLIHLARACREENSRPFVVFAGTVTQVGIPSRMPVDETHADRPVTFYDLHKWLAEQYLKRFSEEGILRGVSLRLSNVYGPGPESSAPDRGILNRMIQKALRGEPLTVYGKGAWLRDFLYVEDAARAFLAAGTQQARLNGRHFVIGSGRGTALVEAFRQVAEQVRLTTGRTVEVRHVPAPHPLSPIERRNFVADSSAFSQLTGWRAETTLEKGLALTTQSFRG